MGKFLGWFMKKFIVCVLVNFLFFQQIFGSSINYRWNYGARKENRVDGQLVSTKNFIRVLNLNGAKIPIGSAQFSSVSHKSKNSEIAALVKNLKSSFSEVKWYEKKQHNVTELEAQWGKVNRYLYFRFVEGKNNTFVYSAVGKISYVSIFRDEAIELANRVIHEAKLKKIVSKDETFLCHYFPCAKANDILDSIIDAINNDAGGTTDAGDVSIDSVDSYLNTQTIDGNIEVGGSVEVFGTIDIADSNGVISGATSQITGSLDNSTSVLDRQGTDFNNNLSNFNTSLNSQGDQINNTIQNSTNQMTQESQKWREEVLKDSAAWREDSAEWRKESSAWRQEYKRTNDIAEKMSDPKHMAKVGFATAAGAALGSLFINLAVTGISSGISYIWNELLFDKTNKKIRWENFQQALANIEKVEKDLIDVEKSMNGLINSLVKMAAIKSSENLDVKSDDSLVSILESLSDEKIGEADYIKQFGVYEEGLSRDQIKCKLAYSNSLKRESEDILKLIKFAKENTNHKGLDKGFFCNQISDMKKKLIEGENLLNKLRINLLAGAQQYYEFRENEIEDMKKSVDLINDKDYQEQVAKADKGELKAIESAKEFMDEAKIDRFLDQCREGKGEYGSYAHQYVEKNPPSKFRQDNSFDYKQKIRRKISSVCKKLADAYMESYAKSKGEGYTNLYKKHKALIDNELIRSENRLIGYNVEQLVKEKEIVRKWFEDKKIETVCYMDLHTMDKEKRDLCSRLSPRVIKNYNAVKNAENFWTAACKEDYDQILQLSNDEPMLADVLKNLKKKL